MATNPPNRPMPETYWVVPNRLLAGPYPGSCDETVARERVRRFLDADIQVFLDLTEEGEASPYARWLGDAARHIPMPIPDFGVPSPDQMAQTLDVVDWAIGTRRPLYLHCLGGLGRTGTVVGCFMVRHGMVSGAQALQVIQLLRADTPYAASPSPETDAQCRMVLTWEEGR